LKKRLKDYGLKTKFSERADVLLFHHSPRN
jgi:hypothetical protein